MREPHAATWGSVSFIEPMGAPQGRCSGATPRAAEVYPRASISTLSFRRSVQGELLGKLLGEWTFHIAEEGYSPGARNKWMTIVTVVSVSLSGYLAQSQFE